MHVVTEIWIFIKLPGMEAEIQAKNYFGLYANCPLLLTDPNQMWFVYGKCAQCLRCKSSQKFLE